jgi:hypothetical protein
MLQTTVRLRERLSGRHVSRHGEGKRGDPHRWRAMTPAERLASPDAVLSRSDLRELGYERRAIDAIFRGCPMVVLPGYSRPLIRVSDYTSFLKRCTYDGRTLVR